MLITEEATWGFRSNCETCLETILIIAILFGAPSGAEITHTTLRWQIVQSENQIKATQCRNVICNVFTTTLFFPVSFIQ